MTIATLTVDLPASLIHATPHQWISLTIVTTIKVSFLSYIYFPMVISSNGLVRSPCDYSALAYFAASLVLAFTHVLHLLFYLFKTS